MLNLSAAVLYQARLTPQQPAILYGAERISYAMLADRIVRAAGGLRRARRRRRAPSWRC